jgi:hypothetical protein
VTTEPPGASCAVSREGQQLAVVNPTPGSVTVDKSSRALNLRCERPGNLPAVTSVPSTVQAMTAGNLLVGGVIGLGIDAASGAMHQYPSSVALTLPPAPAETAAVPASAVPEQLAAETPRRRR